MRDMGYGVKCYQSSCLYVVKVHLAFTGEEERMKQHLLSAAALLLMSYAGWASDLDYLKDQVFKYLRLEGPTLAQRASQWKCTPSSDFICIAKGCTLPTEVVPGMVSVHLDFRKKTYTRCGDQGCDTYDRMIFSDSGSFTNVSLPYKGVFLKPANDGSEYVEIVTLLTNVYLKFGSCKPIR